MQPSIIKVFVSCPGDVTPEKDIVISVCHNINTILSEEGSSFRFEVLDFRDIVAPFDSGRSQEEINNRFSDYDIYLGILWMRFGTPSGGSDPITGKPYGSGTEEEFRIALNRYENEKKIRICFFFKDFGEARGKDAIKQSLKVEEFKEELFPLGWVNTFSNDNPVGFTLKIDKFLMTWLRFLEKQARIQQKEEFFEEKTSTSEHSFDPEQFTQTLPPFRKGILRTLSDFDSEIDPTLRLYREHTGKNILDILNEEKYTIILGNAGSGKSTELANAVHNLKADSSSFIPVFHRLNTYVDQQIEEFLPMGWQDIPQEICLVVLDGLDEVQPQHFNTAIRNILSFISKYPAIRMIVSCRTNFYDFPGQNSNGTLPEFKIYFLDDISVPNIVNYASESGVKGREFYQEAHNSGFTDLITQPFFLNIFLSVFKETGSLDINRGMLLNSFIEQRMMLDEEHFKLTKNLKNEKAKILRLLRKLALIMEYMGKNYLSFSELSEAFPIADDIELVKYSTAFKSFENDPDKWGFEHNNIQEFLAASALNNLTIEEIKSFISFDQRKIKPSWVNTIFFLMGILESEKRDALVNWILTIEPDVLVKIEPDKIDESVRLKIFIEIFNHYKAQGVWLRSNKFTTRELANFPPVKRANVFLLEEVRMDKNSKVVRLNAVELLKYQSLSAQELDQTKAVLLDLIEAFPDDSHVFYPTANTLVALKLADLTVIERLMELFGKRKNQYFRTGFYNLILSANLQNEYIDYAIDGLYIKEKDDDREQVHLMDEDYSLRRLFESNLDKVSIMKILDNWLNSMSNKMFLFRDKQEILRNIISNAVRHNNEQSEFFDIMLALYKKNSKTSEETLSSIVNEFFVKTGTQLKVFKEVFKDASIGAFEKSLMYKQLLTREAVDFVLDEYIQRNFTNRDLLDFYDNASWFGRTEKQDEIEYLKDQFHAKTDLLQNRDDIDYQKIRLDKERENLKFYFSTSAFEEELEKYFHSHSDSPLDWEALWKDKRYDYDPSAVNDAIFDLLVDFTRGDKTVTLEEIKKFTANRDRFENYLFGKLKDKLKNNSALELDEQQMQILSTWVIDRAEKSDIVNSIKKRAQNSFSYNNLVLNLWYYISKYSIIISNEKMLDFTIYSEPTHNYDISVNFEIIERQVGKESVIERVARNLQEGIDYDDIWINNAHYAITNKKEGSYPFLLRDLADEKKSPYSRAKILKAYANSTNDYFGLFSVLHTIGKDKLRWDIFNILTKKSNFISQTEALLLDIISDADESLDDKFSASKYLTQIGNKLGTLHYLRTLQASPDNIQIDNYHDGAYLRLIRDYELIHEMIELLEFASRTENKMDDFDRLDNLVSEGILNIAAQSEKNMLAVKAALLKFIETNTGKIENVNFFHPMIERMEFSFFLAQSQKATIKEAIAEVKKLNL